MARGSTLPAPRRGLRGAIAYRGGEGMLAWAFHRISGIAVSTFLTLHVVSIFLVGANPELYDALHLFYASAPGKVAEVLLGAALLYHALNGTRIVRGLSKIDVLQTRVMRALGVPTPDINTIDRQLELGL